MVVVVVEMEVVVEVGMKILDMGMTYSCKALLLSRPYPAVRVFFLHQRHCMVLYYCIALYCNVLHCIVWYLMLSYGI